MRQAPKIPRREWLAAVLPLTFALALLGSIVGTAKTEKNGVLIAACCFAGGAAVPVLYTVVRLREGTLFLRDRTEIQRNRRRIAASQGAGWILGAVLVALATSLGGSPRVVLVSVLAGLIFGFWPGLLANFIRLRREGHWT